MRRDVPEEQNSQFWNGSEAGSFWHTRPMRYGGRLAILAALIATGATVAHLYEETRPDPLGVQMVVNPDGTSATTTSTVEGDLCKEKYEPVIAADPASSAGRQALVAYRACEDSRQTSGVEIAPPITPPRS